MRYVGNSPVLKGQKIKDLFRKPARMSGQCITVLFSDCDEKSAGFSVKRKTAKNNVERNYLKRLLRESYRKNESFFNDKYCYFFIALKREIAFNDICKDMKEIANRIKK